MKLYPPYPGFRVPSLLRSEPTLERRVERDSGRLKAGRKFTL